MEVKIVGSIQFKNRTLPVYGNLDEPRAGSPLHGHGGASLPRS